MQNTIRKIIAVGLVLSFLSSILLILLIPFLDRFFSPFAKGPGSITVLGVGLVMILFTAVGVIYFGAKSSLNLPKKLLLFIFLYNTLIVVVKFVISPFSVYEASLSREIFFLLSENLIENFIFTALFWVLPVAAASFLLYFIVFFSIYSYFKRIVKKSIPLQDTTIAIKKVKRHKIRPFLWITLLVVTGLLIGGIFIESFFKYLSLIFSGVLVSPMILIYSFLDYLSFIFSTVFGIPIILALVGAVRFVIKAFDLAAKQAIILQDILTLSSSFLMGMVFLFIYHALWVVYLLTLISLWPLETVFHPF